MGPLFGFILVIAYSICCAGTFAGLMQTAITTPTELLKIRLQLQTKLPGMPGYVGPLRLLRQVTRREGISGAHFDDSGLICDRYLTSRR